MQTDKAEIEGTLMQLLGLEPTSFKIEIEILLGSVVVRVKITPISADPKLDNIAETKSLELAEYYDAGKLNTLMTHVVVQSSIGTD